MNLNDAKILAELLIEEHLSGKTSFSQGREWTFAWNNRKRAFGVCSYKHAQIQLSRVITATEEESKVEDTILHEIAHALAGPAAGHGFKWQMVARSIGATPKASAAGSEATNEAIAPTWVMVHGNKIVKPYLRKPNAKTFEQVAGMWLRGRPETKGELQIIPYAQYKRIAG